MSKTAATRSKRTSKRAKTVREGLEIVRELIASGWTRGREAAYESGSECEPTSPNACKFCLTGAIERAVRGPAPAPSKASAWRWSPVSRSKWRLTRALRARLATEIKRGRTLDTMRPATSIIYFNDERARSKEQVLAVIDAAIASLPKKKPTSA